MTSIGPVEYVVIGFPGNRVRRHRRRGRGMLSDEDLELAAEVLELDSSAALIVWEHRWARWVARAIRDAGGRIIAGVRTGAS
jgi:hypothetical protein